MKTCIKSTFLDTSKARNVKFLQSVHELSTEQTGQRAQQVVLRTITTFGTIFGVSCNHEKNVGTFFQKAYKEFKTFFLCKKNLKDKIKKILVKKNYFE